MNIRLIAFDLDGTLLDDRKNLPPENLDALQAAAAAGVMLVPATGRILKGLPDGFVNPGLFRYFIFANGAEIYDLQEERCLHRAGIEPALAAEVCRYMDTLPVLYDCYRDGMGYMTAWMYEQAPDYFGPEPEILKLVKSLRRPVPELKEDILRVNRPLEKLQMYFSVSAGKGKALRRLCELLGLRPEESAAFGDGLNDIEMLEAAGIGCAMANAGAAVRAAADRIVESNNDAGVGKEIFRILAS